MTYETVAVETNPADIAVLTLNRPGKLNALTDLMFTELHAAVRELETRDDVRAIILTARAAGSAQDSTWTWPPSCRPCRQPASTRFSGDGLQRSQHCASLRFRSSPRSTARRPGLASPSRWPLTCV